MQDRWYGPSYHRIMEDVSRCIESVCEQHRNYQCSRKRGYGQDGLYCKQHDPAAKEERRKAGDIAYRKRCRREKFMYGGRYIAALRKIADGHNDPRALAIEALSDLEEPLK